MTTAEATMTLADLSARVKALEAKIVALEEELEQAQISAAIRRSEEQIERGEFMPVREAAEKIRKKYNIPRA